MSSTFLSWHGAVDLGLRMISARAYDLHMEQLFEKARRIRNALNTAGIPYCQEFRTASSVGWASIYRLPLLTNALRG